MERVEEVRRLLRRLDGKTADELESENLEFKSWDPDPKARKSQLRETRETVVCFANAAGGLIVLGVADQKRTRAEAIHGVRGLRPDELRQDVYRGTEPPILVDVAVLPEPEGELLLVRVPRGIPPHTTTEGVAKVRVGKECRPLTGSSLARILLGRGDVDPTARVLEGATLHDLDPSALLQLKRHIRDEGGKPDLAEQDDRQVLESLRLVRDGHITLAAVLLAGSSRALARYAPTHEIVFLRHKKATEYDVRHDLRGPLLFALDALKQFLEAHLRMVTTPGTGFLELTVPDLTWNASREAILNAVTHRDYFLSQSIHIALFANRLEVTSPGGFLGGVTAENVLRHAPVRRNALLAESFQALGFVNRAGLGVDRMYEELLRLGKSPPRYEADESTVRLALPLKTQRSFAAFVADEYRKGRRLDLDELIVLRAVTDRGLLDRWSAAKALQLPEGAAAATLVRLRERRLLVPEGRGAGTIYRLPRELSDQLRGAEATDLDLPLDDEAVRLRVRAVLAERGRLTNADVRRLTGYSRPAAVRLMARLREEGLAKLEGRGRSAAWVKGPALPPSARRRRRK